MHQTDGVAKVYLVRSFPQKETWGLVNTQVPLHSNPQNWHTRQIQIPNTVHLCYTGLFSTKKHQKTWSCSRKNHPSTSRWGQISSFKPFLKFRTPSSPHPKKTHPKRCRGRFPQPSRAETPPCLRIAFVPRAIHGLHQPVKVPCPSRYVARAANP